MIALIQSPKMRRVAPIVHTHAMPALTRVAGPYNQKTLRMGRATHAPPDQIAAF
jgi:hypothetical protein